MPDLSPAGIAFANKRFVTASGFARADCPFCLQKVGKEDHKACLAISVKTGYYNCWRCHARGRIRIDGTSDDWEIPEPPAEIEAPEGFLELCVQPALGSLSCEDARNYLRGRGLDDEEVWREARVGCCLQGRWANRVIVPVLAPTGEWWGWVSRRWSKVYSDYKTAPGMQLGAVGRLYNQEALAVQTDDPVLVVEGALDALAYWPDAVSVLGKPTVTQIDTLEASLRPVAIVLDGDAWEEAEMVAKRLRFHGVSAGYVRLPPKIDPDEVDKGWLREEAKRSLA